MAIWWIAIGMVAFLIAVLLLRGLHRLALRLEDRGYIYYLRKQPSGRSANCFVPLQEIVEPQAQHLLVVRERIFREEGDAAGSDPSSMTRVGPPRSGRGRNL